MRTIEQRSRLAAPAATVWAQAVTPAGINYELGPLLRMTMPAALRDASIDDVPTGRRLGRGWLLLGGLLPVDFDDLCLEAVEPGRRFAERSRMLSFSVWTHERSVEPRGPEACDLIDRLGFELRRGLAWLPGAERLAAAIVAAVFRHRHRRLRRRYG